MILERNALLWLSAAGAALVGGATTLASISWRFGYAFEVPEMPILPMVGVLIAMGVAYLLAMVVVRRISESGSSGRWQMRLLLVVFLVGAAARLVLLASTPILEDDFQRYLWDGAVASAGHNPYALVPKTAATHEDPGVRALAEAAGLTLERVNHNELRTVYPPGAQAFFALAHKIVPFNLTGWRLVVYAADLLTLGLLLLLLRGLGIPLIWSAAYWLNPIVIKELANSVHMEAVLMPFVVAAVILAIRRKPWLTTTMLAVAGAVKIWPLALFPVLIRAATDRVAIWIGACIVVVVATLLWMLPMVLAGLDQTAGVVAYAEKWRTNSALSVALLWGFGNSGLSDLTGLSPNHLARGFVALGIVTAGFALAIQRPSDARDVARRASLVTIIVFLLSPAQFPWYFVWVAPFLAVLPLPGLLFLTVTMPLYYVAFHLMSIDAFSKFNSIVIWLVWCPVWALLMMQLILYGPMARGRAEASLTCRGS